MQTAKFTLSELQAKWLSLILSGQVLLPSKEMMLADIDEHYRSMEEEGIPKHHTHCFFHLKVHSHPTCTIKMLINTEICVKSMYDIVKHSIYKEYLMRINIDLQIRNCLQQHSSSIRNCLQRNSYITNKAIN